MLIDKSSREKVDIPHEPGEWVELAPLAYGDLKKAASEKDRLDFVAAQKLTATQDAATAVAIRSLSKTIRDELGEDAIQRVKAGGFWDRHSEAVIFAAAITAWSYSAPASPENFDQLDPATAEWLRKTIETRNTIVNPDFLAGNSNGSMKARGSGQESSPS